MQDEATKKVIADLGKRVTDLEADLRRRKSLPRVGVHVIITDKAGRMLLGLRAHEPNKGCWGFPGGGLEAGETIWEAGEREVLEETGLIVRCARFAPQVVQGIGLSRHSIVLFLHNVEILGGQLKAASDVTDVRWFDPDEILKMYVGQGGISPVSKAGWGATTTPAISPVVQLL